MKIVLDTNVLIAALISQGLCHTLLEHCVHSHQTISSDFILQELHQNLFRKFDYSLQETKEVIQLLQGQMEMVVPVPLKSSVSRDPDDDMILATALTGGAECIVTGDKDLLVLKQFEAIDIVSPSDFAEYEAFKV